MTRNPQRCLLPLFALLLVLAPSGCVTFAPVPPAVAPAGVKEVKLGGDGIQLGEAQQPGLTREEFTRRMNELLAEGKTVSACRWVRRYPDVALDALRNVTESQAGDRTMQAIARMYDEQCCRVDASGGWAALLKDRAEHADHYVAPDAARRQLLDHLHNNRVKEAAEVRLTETVKGAPGTMLRVDALQLSGEVLLLANRPKDAVTALGDALKLAGTSAPHQAVHLRLLYSEAQRRSGRDDLAIGAWKEATDLACTLLGSERAFADPGLWERIAYLRPVSTAWPAVVAQQLSQCEGGQVRLPSAAAAPTPAGIEAQVWTAIAEWRLRRGEGQAALVAFKRAETLAAEPASRDWLKVGEARALAQLNQRASALAILTPLADNPHVEASGPALAALGALQFKDGQIIQARTLLLKAVGPGDSNDWQGRAAAEADLGLACLTLGEEAEGLGRLHEAEHHFEAAGEFELLQQCLWNEAAYLDHLARRDEAAAVRERSRKLESPVAATPNRAP